MVYDQCLFVQSSFVSVQIVDPLSDVLSLIKPRNYASGGLTAPKSWALSFIAFEGIKCYSVVQGECWLSCEGLGEPIRIEEGDCVLLPHGRPFVLASDLTLPHMDAGTFFAAGKYNGIQSLGSGGVLFLLGCHFSFEQDASFLLDVLPPILTLHKEQQKESLRWPLERLVREMREPAPGGVLVAQQIAYMLLIEFLRVHLTETRERGTGWLSALADKRMRMALSCLHADPAHAWTLQELAGRVGMSRTAFAQSFKRIVGTSVMDYLTHWRMTLAVSRMRDSKATMSEVAALVGYESESAFSVAFKRTWGASPRKYLRHLQY